MLHSSCGLLASIALAACSVDSRHPEIADNMVRPGGDAATGAVGSGDGAGLSAAVPPDQGSPNQAGSPDQEGAPTVGGLRPVGMVDGVANAACDGDAGACVSAGDAGGACAVAGPRDCTSKLDNDCDGLPDDTIDAVCVCAPGSVEPCDIHPGLDGRGQCHPGSRTCVAGAGNATSNWGDCQGSVGPGAQDSCSVEGDDSNCDGTNNGGCPCVEGEMRPCGPDAEVGICKKGTQTCTNGSFGACVGAVFPALRNCNSNADNDCDGRPDNTIDSVCTCAIGAVQACGTHPGRDGNGPCRAGSQTCQAGAGNATSSFGACTGSVGPGARNCASAADNDCDGRPDNTFDNVCLAPQNPFNCSNASPPDTVLPFDLFNTDPNTGLPITPAGGPPAGSGGTVRNGRYVPTHVDVFGAAAAPAFTVFEMTFEFRDGFVQIGYQIFIGTGAVLASDDVQFVGSFTSVGNTLRFNNVQGCEPPPCTSFTGLSCVVPASLAYSVTATGLVTIQPASDGSTVVITYTRQ